MSYLKKLLTVSIITFLASSGAVQSAAILADEDGNIFIEGHKAPMINHIFYWQDISNTHLTNYNFIYTDIYTYENETFTHNGNFISIDSENPQELQSQIVDNNYIYIPEFRKQYVTQAWGVEPTAAIIVGHRNLELAEKLKIWNRRKNTIVLTGLPAPLSGENALNSLYDFLGNK